MTHYELSVEIHGTPTRKRLCVDAEEAPEGGDKLTYTEGGKTQAVVLPNGQAVTILDACTNWGIQATLTKA
jgi:hypothetical protein